MRVVQGTPRFRLGWLVVGTAVALLQTVWPGSGQAGAADPRLERAVAERQAMQGRLDSVLQRVRALEAQAQEVESQLDNLRARVRRQGRRADRAAVALATQLRSSYKRGSADPLLTLFAADRPAEVREQAELLGMLAVRSRSGYERATAVRTRTRATAEQVAALVEVLDERRADLEAARAEAAGLVDAAERAEQVVRDRLAAEEAARARAAAAEAARAARVASADRSARQAPAPAPASSSPAGGGVACPVGQPRSYSDTWGAPRSGGRQHLGTDILAPRGTPVYAYEDGTVSRLNSSSLGGISVYLAGDSGTQYYYTHLQGYVAGLGAGKRVAAGEQVAYNGDTGNAAGVPHVHFEVMPGGGGNVNPYPYVQRACG